MSLSVVKASEQNPLGYEKITRLLTKYAVPSIISMLVNSLLSRSIRFVFQYLF